MPPSIAPLLVIMNAIKSARDREMNSSPSNYSFNEIDNKEKKTSSNSHAYILLAFCLFFILMLITNTFLSKRYSSYSHEYQYILFFSHAQPEFKDHLYKEGFCATEKCSYISLISKLEFWQLNQFIDEKGYLDPQYAKYNVKTQDELMPFIKPVLTVDDNENWQLEKFARYGLGQEAISALYSDNVLTHGEIGILEAKIELMPSENIFLNAAISLYGNAPKIKAFIERIPRSQLLVKDEEEFGKIVEEHILTTYSKYGVFDDYEDFLTESSRRQKYIISRINDMQSDYLTGLLNEFNSDGFLSEGEVKILSVAFVKENQKLESMSKNSSNG